MELCSLEDAFPDIGKVGPSREERRAARKKAKRCKTGEERPPEPVPEESPPVDPDRPAVKRLGEVAALMSYNEAFPDLSGVPRQEIPFVTRPSTNGGEEFRMPTLPGANTTFADQGLPGYFGKDVDDEEGFADYSANPKDNPGYFLSALEDGAAKGVAKAGSGGSPVLPVPSVSDVWKPLTPAGATTSFVDKLPAPGGQQTRRVERTEPELPKQVVKPSRSPAGGAAPVSSPDMTDTGRDALLLRIQELSKRLEELESRGSSRNSQQDLLMFVGAGLFLLVSFDLVSRATRGRR
jgi:hypothetical protein